MLRLPVLHHPHECPGSLIRYHQKLLARISVDHPPSSEAPTSQNFSPPDAKLCNIM